MNRELKFIKSPTKIRCHCNDQNCSKNKTCETDGFCYQNLIFQIKNGSTIKKLVKGCSSNRHIDFYYCNHYSNQTSFICCNQNFCNNLPISKLKLNIRENLFFICFLVSFIVLIVLIVVGIRMCCKKKFKKQKKIRDIESGELNKPKLKQEINSLIPIKQGKFKKSYFGVRKGEKVFVEEFDKKLKKNWSNEAEVYGLSSLSHENIVDFVAKDKNDLLIVTIYYENSKSLTDFLKTNRNLNEYQLIELMLSASFGLNHLHYDLGNKPSIAHRNLNSDNFIVIDSNRNLKCKLTDFSNALTYTHYERLEQEKKLKKLKKIVCDPKYCPPEYFNQTINLAKFSSFLNADIYSFSLVLWQISNHYSNQNNDQLKAEVNNNQIGNNQENNEIENNNQLKAEVDNNQTENDQIENNKIEDNQIEDNQIENDEIENNRIENNQITSQNNEISITNDDERIKKEGNQESQKNSDEDDSNFESPEFRYLKPFEEYFYGNKKSEYEQMKELLKLQNENSVINRPTIYFDASKIRTFNGYVIIKLIEECWSSESNSRQSISRIVKDLNDLYDQSKN